MGMNTEQLLRGIASCADFGSIECRVMSPLARALGTRSAVLLQFEARAGGGRLLTRNFYTGGEPTTLSLYSSGPYEQDPLVSACMRSFAVPHPTQPTHRVLSLSRSFGPSRLRQSDYYRQFLRPSGFDDIIGIAVPIRRCGSEIITLGFQRRTGEGCFEVDEERLLHSIGSCLSHVLRDLVFEERLAVSDAAIEGLTCGKTTPLLAIVGPDGRLHFATSSLLARRGLSELELERDLDRHFGSAFGAWRRGETDGEQLAIRIEQAGRASPYAGMRLLKWDRDGPNPLFLLTLPTDRSALAGDVAARRGLTTQEAVVSSLLCAGHGNSEIGARLSISIRTVENHLRSIYRKLEVNTRAQAIARLIGG